MGTQEPLIDPRPSWNPLECHKTEMSPSLLLMAKLIVICLILKGYLLTLPDHFLPFIPVFDNLGTPFIFQKTLQSLFLVFGFMLLCNRRVRLCCIVLGLVFLVATLSSRVYYRNGKVFCGCILFLAGFYNKTETPVLLRLQIVLVYLGSGINKIFDAQWRNGEFFEYLMVDWLDQEYYTALSNVLPELLLSKLMGWCVILSEFAIALGFLLPALYGMAVWISIFFHTGALVLTGNDYGIFYTAALASCLAFGTFSGDIRACRNEFFRSFSGKQIFAKFEAVKKFVLFHPLFYFSMAFLLCLPRGAYENIRTWIAVIGILIFFPYNHVRLSIVKIGKGKTD